MNESFEAYDLNKTFAEQAEALYARQLRDWPDFQAGADALKGLRLEKLETGEPQFVKLFNPTRIVNIKADLSAEGIARRKCFLCIDNLPVEQGGLELDGFVLLCNPRPIFPKHFTFSSMQHEAQSLPAHLDLMIKTAALAGQNYCIFFNGARAGASAPDHMHFQICPASELPLVDHLNKMELASPSVMDVLGAGYLLFQESDASRLNAQLLSLLEISERLLHCGEESINLLMSFSGGTWKVVFVPRKKHRPACFDGSEDTRLLVSPAAVETAGALVLPRLSDFERLSLPQLCEIWRELYFSPAEVGQMLADMLGR
jgi:hypothetical protein